MFSRDYIMRLIEEFARMLAAISGLKLEGKLDEALKKVDDAYNDLLHIAPSTLMSLKGQEVIKVLQDELKFESQQLRMVAELLYEQGQIYNELGDPVSAKNVFEKARILIGFLMENDSTFSFDWYEKLRIIDEQLST